MLRIGTRGSELALWQARRVKQLLLDLLCVHSEIIVIKTQGDVIQNIPLSQLEGKGFFTKEIEDALLDGTIDLAIHSLKDLPTQLPPGLKLGAIPERADSRDRLLIRPESYDPSQPLFIRQGSVVGSSSNRRIDQILQLQPGVKTALLRGNVPTRVQKLRNGDYDAILLATAGLNRLGVNLDGLKWVDLDPQMVVSAPAQGALGIEIRDQDPETEALVSRLHDHQVAALVQEERLFLRMTEGGCHASVGAFACQHHSRFQLTTYWNTGSEGISLTVSSPESAGLAGKSFLLHQKMHKKLPGTVWIVREKEKSARLESWLLQAGKKVHCLPVIRTETRNTDEIKSQVASALKTSDWMLLTSPSAVNALRDLGIQVEPRVRVAVIGPETAKAAETAGIHPDYLSPVGNSGGLADAWTSFAGEAGTVFYPSAELSSDQFSSRVRKAGWVVHQVPVYRTVPVPVPESTRFEPDYVIVYSASAVSEATGYIRKKNLTCRWISIGPVTTEALRKAGIEPAYEAAYPEPAELLAGVLTY